MVNWKIILTLVHITLHCEYQTAVTSQVGLHLEASKYRKHPDYYILAEWLVKCWARIGHLTLYSVIVNVDQESLNGTLDLLWAVKMYCKTQIRFIILGGRIWLLVEHLGGVKHIGSVNTSSLFVGMMAHIILTGLIIRHEYRWGRGGGI